MTKTNSSPGSLGRGNFTELGGSAGDVQPWRSSEQMSGWQTFLTHAPSHLAPVLLILSLIFPGHLVSPNPLTLSQPHSCT